jgi:hypothetical protein
MTTAALKTIADAMSALGLEYAFGVYAGDPVVYPYFVGEYTETEPMTEDGLQNTTFLLTGFHRGTWMELEQAKERIENYFNRVSGKTVITDSGSGVAIFYANTLIVPTGDAELKRIQINLQVKEWKVN